MGNILVQMSEIKDLSPSERHVVDYILEHYQDASKMGIVELGEKTFTSTTTVKRLCRKLGVDSYTNFRMLLSAAQDGYMRQEDLLSSELPAVGRGDSVGEILEKVSQETISSIMRTNSLNDVQLLEKVVSLMAKAKRIDFYGIGPSHVVAADAQIKCMRLTIPSTAFNDRVSMLTSAKAYTEGALAFLISYTGETDDIVEIARALRKYRVTTVAITSAGNNTLASLCRYNLYVDACQGWDRLGGMFSRISTLNIMDALFTALLNTNYDRYILNMADTSVKNRQDT